MISVIHKCLICDGEILGKSGVTPITWGKFMDNSMICKDCIESWGLRFGELPPLLEIGGVTDDPFKENDNDNK